MQEYLYLDINKCKLAYYTQSAPKLENRKTSPCSPRTPNSLHMLPSRMVGWNELCNPDLDIIESFWSLIQNNTATGPIYIYCVWLRLKLWRRPKPDQISRIWQGSDWPHCDQADVAVIKFGLSFLLVSNPDTSSWHWDQSAIFIC